MGVKLIYFEIPGLGEPIRLILAGTNVKFEDHRVTKEEWHKLKPTLKWPHLPILEIDDQTLYHSLSICRYLARKSDLCGSSENDSLACDMAVDALDDLRKKTIAPYFSPDSKERGEALKNVASIVSPFYMKNFENQLIENNGYFVGGKLTWADIVFLAHSEYISHLLGEDILTNFPNLKKHQQKLSHLQGIKEYLSNRPPYPKDMQSLFS